MVKYQNRLPRGLAREVNPLLKRWSWLVPSWCHVMQIVYDDTTEDVASICGRPQYRDALLTIGPPFIGYDDDSEKEATILHEILHLHQAAATDVLNEVLQFVPEGPFRDTFDRRYEYANEGAVCDLVTALMSR